MNVRWGGHWVILGAGRFQVMLCRRTFWGRRRISARSGRIDILALRFMQVRWWTYYKVGES